MGYEVLSDDLYSENEDTKKDFKKHKKPKISLNETNYSSNEKKSKTNNIFTNIKPIFIHLIIIIIILGGIIYFFSSNFNFSNENNSSKIITLVGDLNQFNKSINTSSLNLYSADFILTTKNGVFTGTESNFLINNFSGNIVLINNTIILDGNSNKITFGKSSLNLKNEKFQLESRKKTNIKINFNSINLNFNSGKIIIGEILNYEFKNSSILLNKFNCSMNYDNTFSFSGYTDSFKFNSKKDKLKISYN